MAAPQRLRDEIGAGQIRRWLLKLVCLFLPTMMWSWTVTFTWAITTGGRTVWSPYRPVRATNLASGASVLYVPPK